MTTVTTPTTTRSGCVPPPSWSDSSRATSTWYVRTTFTPTHGRRALTHLTHTITAHARTHHSTAHEQLEDGMQKYWKNFDHYFMVLRDFALIGDEERQLLLAKHVPGLLIDFYLGEESPLRYLHGKVQPLPPPSHLTRLLNTSQNKN